MCIECEREWRFKIQQKTITDTSSKYASCYPEKFYGALAVQLIIFGFGVLRLIPGGEVDLNR